MSRAATESDGGGNEAVASTSRRAAQGNPPGTSQDGRPPMVRSVERALALVEIIAEGPAEGLSLSDASRALGMSKSSTLATARTLVELGYLQQVERGGRYKLGIAFIRLGDQVTRQMRLGEMCKPILRDLAQTTAMTSRLAVGDHGHPLFVARDDGPGTVRFHTPLGLRESPHSTAAGKAMLAMMPEHDVRMIATESGLPRRTQHTITDADALLEDLAVVRIRGFAIDDEEDAEGVYCIAAPFFDHSRVCAGAISVTGIKVELDAEALEELAGAVRTHAGRISRLLDGPAYDELEPQRAR